ncbi:hypothetical protein EDB80DRAFT_427713 [Ilyonectria destructans]|nr:hypothetical protein EDB80DRAFT_427713 [Ilyonectria destructans]
MQAAVQSSRQMLLAACGWLLPFCCSLGRSQSPCFQSPDSPLRPCLQLATFGETPTSGILGEHDLPHCRLLAHIKPKRAVFPARGRLRATSMPSPRSLSMQKQLIAWSRGEQRGVSDRYLAPRMVNSGLLVLSWPERPWWWGRAWRINYIHHLHPRSTVGHPDQYSS